MRIGVDAVALEAKGAGVARYVSGILLGMMTNSSRDDFVLYSWRPIHMPAVGGSWRAHIATAGRWSAPGAWLRDTLPRMIAEDGIDVFWGQNTVMPMRLARPCRRVLTVHDVTGFVVPRTMQFAGRLYWNLDFRAAVRSADAIIAVSSATAHLLCRLLGVGREQVRVIYEGCSLRPGAGVQSTDGRDVVSRLGLPAEFMLTVGTLEPRKDHATLLAAIERGSGFPPLAIVGGPGWNSRGILRLVRDAERDGRAIYVGRVSDEDLAGLYRAARIMVYPSLYEGFGLPVLEAMVCGCPVLCSWSSSMPEVGGTAACYFRPGDAADLASRLKELLRDDERLADMRSRGIERASKFNLKSAAEQTLHVLHGSGPPVC